MDAGFRTQPAERVISGKLHGSALYAGHVPGREFGYLRFHAALFTPPEIHAQQHFSPILSFGPAGTSVNGNNGVVLVVLAVKNKIQGKLFYSFLNGLRFL